MRCNTDKYSNINDGINGMWIGDYGDNLRLINPVYAPCH